MSPPRHGGADPPAGADAGHRLHKRLADLGYGSRREIERWIEAGRVSVNGRLARLGERVGPADVIRVDGHQVVTPRRPLEHKVLRYHKPAGEVCTRSDPHRRPTVFDALPRLKRGRWVSVGRLDASTSGLLLFTDDGALAHRLMHPSGEIEREYAVRIKGEVRPEILQRLRTGVDLDGEPASFDRVEFAGGEGSNRWFKVVLRRGRNREVRRLWESQGVVVSRLIRVRFGPIGLPRGLRAGRWELLGPPERGALEAAGAGAACASVAPGREARPGGAGGATASRSSSRRGARSRAPRSRPPGC